MDNKKSPRLRTVRKSLPAYPLNKFNSNFPYILGKEIIYMLASKGGADLQGNEWEQIFALCIGADWKPSNVGLDDVVLGNTAWGAKTVISSMKDFKNLKKVRLISGRNSPLYSYGEKIDTGADPNLIGELVLEIWNERVSAIREIYKHLRTVVLVKSKDLSSVAVFEFNTIRYDSELFDFEWNSRGNLEGFIKRTRDKQFVWQPHGSQFTIIEKVPQESLIIKMKKPNTLDKEKTLEAIGFDKTWITVEKR